MTQLYTWSNVNSLISTIHGSIRCGDWIKLERDRILDDNRGYPGRSAEIVTRDSVSQKGYPVVEVTLFVDKPAASRRRRGECLI
jgi:hypothetical protein